MPKENKNPFATKGQELLLRASLMDGADAAGAWNEWKGTFDVETELDAGSRRLLPLLYKNLKRLGVKDELMGRLKGIYHKAWYRNQKLFFLAGKVLDRLNDEGIRTIVHKGIPLSILYYRNYAVRPMDDFDVLVPASQALLTIDVLKLDGWNPADDVPPHLLMKYRHSLQFGNGSGRAMDLHWKLMFEATRVESLSDFWNKSVPVTVHGVPSSTLDPTDMLFHTIVHGVKWNPLPAIRWIADSVTIMRSSGTQIDWRRIISYAKKYALCLQLREGLGYLRENFQAAVPAEVMDEINGLPVSGLERFEYRILSNDYENQGGLLGHGPLYLTEYLRLAMGAPFLRALAGFPVYVRFRTGKESLPGLFSHLAARSIGIAMGKIKIKIPRPAIFGRQGP